MLGELSGRQITDKGFRRWLTGAGAASLAHSLEGTVPLTRWGEPRILLAEMRSADGGVGGGGGVTPSSKYPRVWGIHLQSCFQIEAFLLKLTLRARLILTTLPHLAYYSRSKASPFPRRLHSLIPGILQTEAKHFSSTTQFTRMD